MSKIQLEASWKAELAEEFEQPYMRQLKQLLRRDKEAKKIIYPHSSLWFNAFNSTPLDRVKVVILGQDPYHGRGQAHGLCFSVLPGLAIPPSLKNIYQELQDDIGMDKPSHGYLQSWAEQGVLLLNATLTVEANKAGSHQGRGWEQFTDRVIEVIDKQCQNLVFLLWGSYAQKKSAWINADKHCLLKAPHPSPLSASRGFFGCRHFSKTNRYLQERQRGAIDWNLPREP